MENKYILLMISLLVVILWHRLNPDGNEEDGIIRKFKPNARRCDDVESQTVPKGLDSYSVIICLFNSQTK